MSSGSLVVRLPDDVAPDPSVTLSLLPHRGHVELHRLDEGWVVLQLHSRELAKVPLGSAGDVLRYCEVEYDDDGFATIVGVDVDGAIATHDVEAMLVERPVWIVLQNLSRYRRSCHAVCRYPLLFLSITALTDDTLCILPPAAFRVERCECKWGD